MALIPTTAKFPSTRWVTSTALHKKGGQYGQGTVYELTRSGNTWTNTVLHSFGGTGDGKFPEHNVIFDRAGNLYGTTHGNGNGNYGTVFQLVPTGSGWTENILYSFSESGSAGVFPAAGRLMDQSGNLYGATTGLGTNGAGAVFELTPSGGGLLRFCTLSAEAYRTVRSAISSWTAMAICMVPLLASLLAAMAGFSNSSPFSNGGWTYVDLHDFTGGADGAEPIGNLTLDAQGNLFGTASVGGSMGTCGGNGCSVVWEITL